jgi:hypothetical protein
VRAAARRGAGLQRSGHVACTPSGCRQSIDARIAHPHAAAELAHRRLGQRAGLVEQRTGAPREHDQRAGIAGVEQEALGGPGTELERDDRQALVPAHRQDRGVR